MSACRYLRRISTASGIAASCVALTVPAYANPVAAGDSLNCAVNEEVEIAVNWVGRTATIVVHPNSDAAVSKKYVFNGGLVRNLSVVRTHMPQVGWEVTVTGTNGFNPPDGPYIDRTDQRCVAR